MLLVDGDDAERALLHRLLDADGRFDLPGDGHPAQRRTRSAVPSCADRGSPLPPAAAISRTVSAAPAPCRSSTATPTRSRASRQAIARPMPEAPPVTIATAP